jgi:AraC-like DNA-binding protein
MRARAAAKASFDTRTFNSSMDPTGSRLSQIAYQFGYSDQAHMNREFQVWFKTSPAKLGLNADFREQIIRPLT